MSKMQQCRLFLNIPGKSFERAVQTLLLLFLALSCGCLPVPQRTNSQIELPPQFTLKGEVPLQAKWWLDLQDSSLDLLIDRAIKDNFSLQIALERLQESRALARQAGAALLPSLDGRATGSSARNHKSNTSVDSVLLGLAASYEIDLWGRLRKEREGALLDAQATEADYQTAVISLTAEIATSWYQLVETELQLELLNQQKETNSKVLQLISSQFRAGQIGIADVLQQRQLLESTISSQAGLRAEARVLEHQLAVLQGRVPGQAPLPRREKLPSLPPLPQTGIPLEILNKRPDINSSYLQLLAADQRVAAAMADRLPKLSLSADLSTTGDTTKNLFNNWLSSLGANLFGPLFDGGRRRAVVERNESLARQQFYRHGQAILDAMVEVENSLAREQEQQIIQKSLETQLKYATDTIKHVSTRYRQGAENYERVLQAFLSQQGLQRNLLSSRRQLLQFRIALYRALSGVIPDQTSPADEAVSND